MKKICETCLYIGKPEINGSFLITIVLLIVFFPAAIIYEIWRVKSKTNTCPHCKRDSLIPLDCPNGHALMRLKEKYEKA